MLKFSEILEFSKEKFRKIPILKEFEWFEWFEMVRMVRSLADRTFQLWRRLLGAEGVAVLELDVPVVLHRLEEPAVWYQQGHVAIPGLFI